MDNSPNEKKRWTISERLDIDHSDDWILSEHLFGDGMIDINDFESNNYNYFLDHVASLDELIAGLQQLSPLADDALSVAENMNERKFQRFKSALKAERDCKSRSAFPKKLGSLILPINFIQATVLTEIYEVSLGVALIKLDEKNQQKSLV